MDNYKCIKYFCSEEMGSARGSNTYDLSMCIHPLVHTHLYTIHHTHTQAINISKKDISITVQVEGRRIRNGTG